MREDAAVRLLQGQSRDLQVRLEQVKVHVPRPRVTRATVEVNPWCPALPVEYARGPVLSTPLDMAPLCPARPGSYPCRPTATHGNITSTLQQLARAATHLSSLHPDPTSGGLSPDISLIPCHPSPKHTTAPMQH